MAALTAEVFAALQSLLKASSKDVVRQLCQESFSSSALGSKKLLDVTCSSLSVTQEEAEQLLQALHRLTRLVVFRDLSSAEAILALFPENFHQNLKNLLTKIILEHVSTWRAEAQTNQNLPAVVKATHFLRLRPQPPLLHLRHSSFCPDIWRVGCSGRSLEVLTTTNAH
ncbi:COMM domain-containing protein 9 isoform X2 [Eubalaena glacialis]|uniref:COMM domain-containing protein 9 isoform X2 n=1 Tax=Eubalaena glacialis TaxID=27606 RepID=UPI002A5A980B|nr:COMM domain-containing protein 9 isoform X2 [Eubalaena glacialis]